MTTTKTVPHVRLDTADLREQYCTGKLTVKGYVYNWLLATRKRGWRYRTMVKDFCTELGISRAAFYKAVAELKAEPGSTFHFEAHGEVEMWIDDDPSTIGDNCHDRGHLSMIVDNVSTIVDNVSTIVDNVSTIGDNVSTIVDNETLEPAHSKASSAPSTISHLSHSFNTTGFQATAEKSFEEQPTANSQQPVNRDPNLEIRDHPTDNLKGHSVSYRLNVAQILEQTRRKLEEQVWTQASRVNHKKGFIGVSHAEIQGSSLTPDQSDPITTTTSASPLSVKPAPLHPD